LDGSVWLAAQVVPWHNFNLLGFRPVDLQASHPKYQGRCRQAEPFGFLRSGIDFLSQALTFTWICHFCSLLRCEMKSPTYVAELQKKLGAPSSETVESLRLLKAFQKLRSDQRSEFIELVERLVTNPLPDNSSLS
jgi:hypothetical protein